MELDMPTFEELKQMSGADFIHELVDTFLDDSPRLVEQMKSALQSNDADSFRRAAHSLKSNSATFGAMRLAGMAKELEMLGKEHRLSEAGSRIPPLEQALGAVCAELQDLQK